MDILRDRYIKRKDIILRLCEINDAEFILSLRLNPSLNKYISHTDINIEQQKKWILAYKDRERRNKELYFIIEDINHNRLGTYRIYNIQENSFTIGSWIFKKRTSNYLSVKADILVKDFGFENLKFKYCRFDVRKKNKKVLKYHRLFEPKLINENKLNYYFELDEETYYINRAKVCKLLGINL